jgi:hypothetical protein
MAKKSPQPGLCVHCQKPFHKLTWDHVLPVAWYPIIDRKVEKWMVPACEECNRKLGKIESRILEKLALCLDPLDYSTFGIPQKIQRAYSGERGKNPEDARRREELRQKLKNSIRIIYDPQKEKILPGFGEQKGVNYPLYRVMDIEWQDLLAFFVKLIRGISYHLDQKIISDDYIFELFFIDEDNPDFSGSSQALIIRDWHHILSTRGESHAIGRSLQIRRFLLDPVGGIYHIKIWNKFNAFVIVIPRENWEEFQTKIQNKDV